MQNYTVYHLHTELSLLDSCTNFKLYVDRAKELGQTAICFTEHGNCYNWIEKKEYCEEQGIKYLHGVEVYLTKELYEYPEVPDEWYESHLGCNEKETQEGLRILEEDASAARKARKASDRRNQEWLEKQHRQKEQEINEFYSQNADKLNEMESLADKRLADRWVKEQENNAEAVRKARKASDRRNQEWLEKQHKQKEQEYSDFWNKELNEKETQEGLRILEEDASVARKARKASDRRNQEWLEKQYRQKELEMNEFYNQHNLRLGYLNVKANVRHFVNSKVDSVKNCFRKIQDKFSKDA